jgi:hypothetical protein
MAEPMFRRSAASNVFSRELDLGCGFRQEASPNRRIAPIVLDSSAFTPASDAMDGDILTRPLDFMV